MEVILRGLPWGERAYLDHSLIDVAGHSVPQWSTLILHGHSSSTEYNSCTSWRGEGSQAEANRHVYALSQSNMSSETDCLVSPPKDTKANPSSQFCGCTVKRKKKLCRIEGPEPCAQAFLYLTGFTNQKQILEIFCMACSTVSLWGKLW